ncbi:MAG TPA: class I SAM-dependent methyltransferase [Pyrinomonadaceae bacterium]|nr:class I SAM-dependent methyltransferase [Pyrinomonadaceae bacterium]
MDLREQFGSIDIYLFDQLLKGRITPSMSILDAGCGDGRNLIYFLRHNFNVFAVDSNPQSIQQVQMLASSLAPNLPSENFIVGDVADMPLPNATFDLLISSAVLHFANDEQHFNRMLDEMWRVLKTGGMLFARLASSIGIEALVKPAGKGRYLLPDGTERFLVDEEMLASATERLRARKVEPLKTTNVENLRCMTTWVVSKAE